METTEQYARFASDAELCEAARRLVDRAGGLIPTARQFSVTPQAVSMALAGKSKTLVRRILERLGSLNVEPGYNLVTDATSAKGGLERDPDQLDIFNENGARN